MFRCQGLAGQGWNRYQASVMAAACRSLCEQLFTVCNFLVPGVLMGYGRIWERKTARAGCTSCTRGLSSPFVAPSFTGQ